MHLVHSKLMKPTSMMPNWDILFSQCRHNHFDFLFYLIISWLNDYYSFLITQKLNIMFVVLFGQWYTLVHFLSQNYTILVFMFSFFFSQFLFNLALFWFEQLNQGIEFEFIFFLNNFVVHFPDFNKKTAEKLFFKHLNGSKD